MKKFQILTVFFIILMLLGLIACDCGYFLMQEDKNEDFKDNLSFSNLSNDIPEDVDTKSSDDQDTNISQKDNNFADVDEIQDNKTPQKYAIIASGASYDRQHYTWFLNSTNMAYKLLRNYNYSDSNIYYLFESDKEPYVDYEATTDNFTKVTEELNNKANELDTLLLFLIGHGTYLGINSYYTLNDYNLSDHEMADMFKNIKREKLIFVFSPCNSGGFIDDLSGTNTIVITSTRYNESNRAAFIEPFLASFDGIGDANLNGKVSFAEAFNYASNNVIEQYNNNIWGNVRTCPA